MKAMKLELTNTLEASVKLRNPPSRALTKTKSSKPRKARNTAATTKSTSLTRTMEAVDSLERRSSAVAAPPSDSTKEAAKKFSRDLRRTVNSSRNSRSSRDYLIPISIVALTMSLASKMSLLRVVKTLDFFCINIFS